MKKKVKIIIIVVLIVAIVVGCIAGGIYYKNSKGIADVISVSSISTTDDNTSLTEKLFSITLILTKKFCRFSGITKMVIW